ncbi:MAG: ATP-binding cassette domain-containing protein [Alphaproteobacteria bacterium]|nr:ATP-binding cassette domain-containing protein [Alphaproteobacteria bacterium]
MTDLHLHNLIFQRPDFSLNVSAHLPKGSKTLLVGASGAGKSTLLSLIAGFLSPQKGTIHWQGEDITHLPPQKRPLTLLFQDHNLFPHLSVRNNVALGIKPSLKLTEEEEERLHEMLKKVGIHMLKERYPCELSGGERQRAALARSLLRKTPLLLLDEPLGPLGPGLRKDMLDLLSQISDEFKLTLLLTTHQPDEAAGLADHMLFLENGEIRETGKPCQLLTAPTHPALKAYLGMSPQGQMANFNF